jgi:hypothetical protein
MSPPGSHRPQADVLRQAQDRPQDGLASGLSPKGEYRSAQHEGAPVTPPRQPLLDALRAAHVRLGVAAVIAAGSVLALLSFLTLRTHVEQNLNLVARSIAYSAEAATVFNDRAAAAEILGVIAGQEGLLAADIVRRGVPMAAYVRDRDAPVDATVARIGTPLFPLQAGATIRYQDADLGQVTVHGNGGVYLSFLFKVVAAVVGCMAVIAWWVARLSRRIESDIVVPLNQLASLTRTARTERALGLRAAPAAVQEIHTLGEDFNALLAEIQSREAELVAKHDHLQSANESLSFLAFHDSLTGLPNRARFLEHASRAVFAGRASAAKVAILYVDSDNFKAVNDGLGHAAGDEVLIETARRIRAPAARERRRRPARRRRVRRAAGADPRCRRRHAHRRGTRRGAAPAGRERQVRQHRVEREHRRGRLPRPRHDGGGAAARRRCRDVPRQDAAARQLPDVRPCARQPDERGHRLTIGETDVA